MKSLHIKLNEALEKMTSKQRDKFYASRKSGDAVEVQLNCADAILTGKVKESTPITKHNGRELFTESGNSWYNQPKETCTKGERIMFDAWLSAGQITEAEHNKLTGAKPEGYNQLSEAQKKEFNQATMLGFNESDAFKLAKMTGSIFTEVSR